MTRAKMAQVYFGVEERKAEEVSRSVVFDSMALWQNGPQTPPALVLLPETHSAQSDMNSLVSQYNQHWYSWISAEPQQRSAIVRLVCSPHTRLLVVLAMTGVPRMPEQFEAPETGQSC